MVKPTRVNKKTMPYLVGILGVLILGFVFFHPHGVSSKKCDEIEKQANSLVNHRKMRQAKDLMSPNIDKCSDPQQLGKNPKQGSPYNDQALRSITTYAKAAYGLGDYQLAYSYSNKGINLLNDGLSSAQRQKNLDTFFILDYLKQNSDPRYHKALGNAR